jgi:hypothetical protein
MPVTLNISRVSLEPQDSNKIKLGHFQKWNPARELVLFCERFGSVRGNLCCRTEIRRGRPTNPDDCSAGNDRKPISDTEASNSSLTRLTGVVNAISTCATNTLRRARLTPPSNVKKGHEIGRVNDGKISSNCALPSMIVSRECSATDVRAHVVSEEKSRASHN